MQRLGAAIVWQAYKRTFQFPLVLRLDNGLLLYADPSCRNSTAAIYTRIYESTYIQFLRRECVRGGSIVDVGAHIGIYTLLLADLFESGVCLEPAPDAHSILVKNLGLNGLHRFNALRLGASSASGRAVLTAEGPYNGEARIVADDAVAAIRFDIEITTVDALIQPSWKVTFIKIDTEGHEPEVIAGAVETLRRSPEALVLFENNPGGRAECMNRLEGLGFRCFALDESGNVSQSAADFKESINALAAGPSHPLSQRLRAL